jgi:transcription initiation factor TFIIIB Brf1 subunit/transcription initiation factor TFIIB
MTTTVYDDGEAGAECPSDPGRPCEPIEALRSGDVVCQKCGLVLERVFDSHAEKRVFEASDEVKKRADMDPVEGMNIGGPELATTVGGLFKPTGTSDLSPGVHARAAAGAPSRKLAAVSPPPTPTLTAMTKLTHVRSLTLLPDSNLLRKTKPRQRLQTN